MLIVLCDISSIPLDRRREMRGKANNSHIEVKLPVATYCISFMEEKKKSNNELNVVVALLGISLG